MNFVGLIKGALKLAGVNTPAFEALFDAAMQVVGSSDKAELMQLYEQAKTRSDDAHQNLQDAGRGR